MNRSTPFVLALVLGAFAVLVPLRAEEGEKTNLERIRDLERSVRELKQDLAAEKRLGSTARLENDIRYQEIADRLASMQRTLDRLTSQSSTSRRAFSIDPNPPSRTGTIVIENQMAEPATVWIDGVSYRVAALSTRTLTDQTAKSIQYAARRTRSSEWGRTTRTTVRAGETLTINVYDQ